MHDVQAPEAAHKINMHLPAARVRHLTNNETQTAMLNYTCKHTLFEELKHSLGFADNSNTVRTKQPGLRLPLQIQHFAGLPLDTHLLRVRHTILHREVRVSILELMMMLCKEYSLPDHRPSSYRQLRTLHINFSQSYVREDSLTLFGNDSRRDIVSLSGLYEGNHLCCEVVCFIRLGKIVGLTPKQDTYVLVRWLEPHPDAWERDEERRPVCPGPLHINNCLWRYARTGVPREVLSDLRFSNVRQYFGDDILEQNRCRDRELYAYYGLVTPQSIMKIENMCPLFKKDTASLDTQSWLQSVVMF